MTIISHIRRTERHHSESLHACTELDEDAVDETAADISRLLWRLGWRNGGES